MRMILSALLLSFAFSTVATSDQGKPELVRELTVKVPQAELKAGGPKNPTVIKNAGDLIKVVKDVAAIQAISKQVDFNKEQILFFSWGGSGGDKLTFGSYDAKANEAVFQYKAGLTRDFRPHSHLYVLPKEATWKIQQPGVK